MGEPGLPPLAPAVTAAFFKASESASQPSTRRRSKHDLAGDTYWAFELTPRVLAGRVNRDSPTVNDEIHTRGRGRNGHSSACARCPWTTAIGRQLQQRPPTNPWLRVGRAIEAALGRRLRVWASMNR